MIKFDREFRNKNSVNVSFILSIVCGLVHLAYLVMFAIMQVWPLVYYNVLSILFYAILALVCIKKPNIFLLAIAEIVISAFYSDIMVGEICGFKLIFVTIIPAIFFILYLNKIKTMISVMIVSGIFVSYLVLATLNQLGIIVAKIQLSSTNTLIISLFNAVIVFAIIIGVSMLFIFKIIQKEVGLENQNERLSKLANVDPLTELLNRRSINQKLELSMQRKINLNVDFTVAIADIDNFKDLNDTYGHDCGDKVLKNIAEEIRNAVRDSDYVCRWGGEEILILFCGSGQDASGRVLERIRKNIEENGGVYQGFRIDVTMTFGVSSSEKYNSVKDIILKADENLYHGKKSGKNCIVYS